jgi:hypothetical protein
MRGKLRGKSQDLGEFECLPYGTGQLVAPNALGRSEPGSMISGHYDQAMPQQKCEKVWTLPRSARARTQQMK